MKTNTGWIGSLASFLMLAGVGSIVVASPKQTSTPLAAAPPNVVGKPAAQSGYAVVERGADYRVLERATVENGSNRVHRYTELATGLHYKNARGQWTESREEITVLPQGGAQAVQGRHQVQFPGNIATGALKVVTPDGRVLQSRPVGVAYDGSSTVFIGVLTNAAGWLTASNQVTYKDCFTGIKADLVCTYRRNGFECDLVFREQPPSPEQFGLDGSCATLQMVTEFFSTADPERVPSASDDRLWLQDETLKFGKMMMSRGRAFGVQADSGKRKTETATAVYKNWRQLDDRRFLVEQVPLACVAENLSALPVTTRAIGEQTKARNLAAAIQSLPVRSVVAGTNQILLASADMNRQPGVVLDYYIEINSDTDTSSYAFNTFKSGQTYYVTGPVTFHDVPVEFQGGTVVKIRPDLDTDSGINLDAVWWLGCPVSAANPAIFTTSDDDSVGELIPGSSHYPGIGSDYIKITGQGVYTVELRHMRFYYSDQAVCVLWGYHDLRFDDCQFINNYNCLMNVSTGPTHFENVLFVGNPSEALYILDGSVTMENVTVANNNGFIYTFGPVMVTNSIFFNNSDMFEGNVVATGSHNAFDDSSVAFGSEQIPLASSPFRNGGNPSLCYLTPDSSCHNAGTTAIDNNLLDELSITTTYAPPDGGYPDNDGQPDLGYHYPAISNPGDPTVTVEATTPIATETGPGVGVFTITRTGGYQPFELNVDFQISGTATEGADYYPISRHVTIPPNASSVTVTVGPILDGNDEDVETVILTLQPSAAYIVGTPNSAVVSIYDIFTINLQWLGNGSFEIKPTANTSPLPCVNFACSGRGTLARANVNSGVVAGEYRTAPDTRATDPSRTTADKYGNVWVANRGEASSSGGQPKGSIARVGVVIGGTRCNADGTLNSSGDYLKPPFVYCTAVDRFGAFPGTSPDGLIKTSRGLADIRNWSNPNGVDNDGGVSSAEDEAILNYTRVASTGTRTVAVDTNNDIWVGGTGNYFHQKVNGVTGLPIPNTAFNAGRSGYGGLIDRSNMLWSANSLIRFDIHRRFNLSVYPPDIIDISYVGDYIANNYGVGIDPNTGHIWITSPLRELKADGTLYQSYASDCGGGYGICVDGNSNVWVACDSSVMHFAPNPANPSQHVLIGSINHFGADAFSYTHGVAVDMNGKIWGPDKNRNAAWRIDPAGGPVINGSHVGAVDMRVDLGSGAGPYNYSDMTGFVLLSETSPSGVWDRVQDSGHAGASWTISWTGNTPAGTAIKAEVRMANQLGGLYSQPFQSITANPQPNCGSGRYIEARFTLSLDKTVTTTSPTLTDVTLTHSP